MTQDSVNSIRLIEFDRVGKSAFPALPHGGSLWVKIEDGLYESNSIPDSDWSFTDRGSPPMLDRSPIQPDFDEIGEQEIRGVSRPV